MNFAEAIRNAAANPSAAKHVDNISQSEENTVSSNNELKVVEPSQAQPATVEPTFAKPVSPVTQTAPTISSDSTIIRLEMCLTPEQLTNLFKAVSATQHSMLTLREAATYLRVSPTLLENKAKAGEIPGFNIDGRWRFTKQNVDEWLKGQTYIKESA